MFPKLVTAISEQQASFFSPHIVISSSLVNSEMSQEKIFSICEDLIDCFFLCLVNRAPAGIYLPAALARKQEENKRSLATSSDDDSVISTNQEEKETHEEENKEAKEDQVDHDKIITEKAIEKLMNQAGGKEAILHSLVENLDNDFFPFYMHVIDAEEERLRAELRVEMKQRGEDTSAADKQKIIVKNPQVGCAFSRRGEMITMGSLEGCGVGIAGVFMNGKYHS